MGHLVVVGRILEEAADFGDDEVVVGTDEFDGAGVEGFGALGGVAHHEDRFSEAGGFFLDAAGVGEDEGALLHQVDEFQVLEGLDEEEVFVCGEVFAEDLVDGFAHVGVEVHWVHEIHLWILLAKVFHGGDHGDESVAEVLAAMAGDEDEFLSVMQSGYIVACIHQHLDLLVGEGFVAVELIDDPVEGVDDSVAGDEDLAVSLFFLEVLLAEGRRGEVVAGNAAGDLAVHFFGPGAVDVVGAQTGFDVADGDLLVKGGEGRGGAGRGVAMDQDDVGLGLFEDVPHAGEDTRGDVVEVLALLHDIEVKIGLDVEDPQDLVEHLTMLPGDADDSLEAVRILLELLDQGADLNRLRPGPENKHYFLHSICIVALWSVCGYNNSFL